MARPWNGLAFVALAALLSACGGGGGGTTAVETPAPQPLAEGALRAAQSGDVVAWFRARIEQRTTQGLSGTEARDVIAATTTGGVPVPATPAAVDVATSAYASTQVQEAGVDEDDLLKTDGSAVYAIHSSYYATGGTVPARLAVLRINADSTVTETGSVTLAAAFTTSGMYLSPAAKRLTVIGQRNGYGDIRPLQPGVMPVPTAALLPIAVTQEIGLDVFDVASGTPAASHHIAIDGRLVATRMIGNVLYVASTWRPDLSRYQLPPGTPVTQVRSTLAPLAGGDLLPTIRVDGGASQPLVNETDCLLQPANATLSLQLTTLTAIDLSSASLERRSRCFVGDASGLYMSPSAVYVTSSQQVWIAAVTASTIPPPQVTTDIHKFALQGLAIDYRASGSVAGTLGWDVEKMPYRMSEYNGDLRVLSFTGQSPSASPATLTVLREDSAQRKLATLATLPNAQRSAPLGRNGEQVYGVQFAGPVAYVVTFRRIDPLYVIDVSNPADPKPAGQLAVPGYSDYLFPLANGKLLGVGKDAGDTGVVQGVKIALFDVGDPSQPRLLASRTLGASGSTSALDASRHGINLFTQGAQVRVALPVRLTSTTASRTASYQQGLARFVVDTAAGTLADRPLVASATFSGADYTQFARYDISKERAVQTTAASYYLTGGQVIATREP